MQMGGWFKKKREQKHGRPKGAKTAYGLAWRRDNGEAGSQINTIPISELYIYMAMEMNTIDAVEWVCLAIDINFGF